MKISQLVATKTKTLYHESVASRLPSGIKTQQQLLNLGYRVAVEDLGLTKAKTLNENFAAKLINSYHRQSLNEGVGSFLGKLGGHVVGAAGAAGRGLSNAWKDAKQGYTDAKGAWDENPPTPAGTGGGAAPAGGGAAPAGGGAAPAGGGADRPYVAPAGGAAGGGIGDIMKAIDGLDPASKKQLAGELDKSINAPAPAAPVAAPAAPGAAPAAPGAAPAAPGAAPPAPEAPPPAPEAPPPAGGTAAPAGGGAAPAGGGAAPAAAPAAPPAGTPPASGKLTQAQQDAKKAELLGKRQAGKTTASQTGTGFNQYVQGGGGSTMAGADAQGNPVFKQNVKRESVEFHSNFLGMDL